MEAEGGGRGREEEKEGKLLVLNLNYFKRQTNSFKPINSHRHPEFNFHLNFILEEENGILCAESTFNKSTFSCVLYLVI